jgi:hypothetical protein
MARVYRRVLRVKQVKQQQQQVLQGHTLQLLFHTAKRQPTQKQQQQQEGLKKPETDLEPWPHVCQILLQKLVQL